MESAAKSEEIQTESEHNEDETVELHSTVMGCSFSDPAEREKVDDISEFCFESDHMALKENKDYHALLRALVLLKTQKIQSIQDIDKLLGARSKAKKDQLHFLENLITRSNTGS
jgi:hypothetical protein